MRTCRSAAWYGRGRSRTSWTTLKMAGVGADAERKRQNNSEAEPVAPPQTPKGVLKVLDGFRPTTIAMTGSVLKRMR